VIAQTAALYRRLLVQQLTDPLTFVNLVLALFFLAVYTGALGGTSAIERIVGADFLTFILPVTILFAALSGSTAGQALVADLESGYLRRLLTLPVSRSALVLAPMLIGATQVVVQAALVVGLGLALGVDVAAGPGGVVALMGLSLLFGLAFAGYAVASGLLAGNAQAAQTASFLFFPLVFLAPTFLPRDQLQGWLEAVSAANPTTYVLEAMRGLLIDGWDAGELALGFGVVGVIAALMIVWATRVAQGVTARS